MIVYTIDKLEDFMAFLPKRLNDEVYFYIDRGVSSPEATKASDITVILHFLAKATDYILCLYQCCLKFDEKIPRETIYEEMKNVFTQTNIKLTRGRISEVNYSIS